MMIVRNSWGQNEVYLAGKTVLPGPTHISTFKSVIRIQIDIVKRPNKITKAIQRLMI